MNGIEQTDSGNQRPAVAPENRIALQETSPPLRGAPLDTGVKHHRCAWAVGVVDYLKYHDNEWGVPVYDDRVLFEFLVLASAQTGLPWLTVLGKRDKYRLAFAGFDPAQVAAFSRKHQARLLKDSGIIRNRLKVTAAVTNAQRFLEIRDQCGSFAAWLWRYVDGVPLQNRFRYLKDIPASTELSDRISRDLKQRGFRFVGTKTVYAYLQAVGVVNDHLVGCFRHGCVGRLAKRFDCSPETS
jgi:DNA-3-methyladenine glycosylase I